MSLAKFEDMDSYIKFLGNVTSLILECYNYIFSDFSDPPILLPHSSFILSFIFISTLHVLARWSVWIIVPSALPISPYVVTVRLKYTV